ncbi:MAG TPA: hypothetical protein VGJ87_08820, partial [Roseiflexaceae bacterium]
VDRLKELRTLVGTTELSRFQYTLNRAGQRTQASETLNSQTRAVAYTYDGVQRLTSALETPGAAYAYAYDLAGNRTQVQVNGVTTESRSYDAANQVVGYTYDAAANLTSDSPASSSYDARNRLTQRNTTPTIEPTPPMHLLIGCLHTSRYDNTSLTHR